VDEEEEEEEVRVWQDFVVYRGRCFPKQLLKEVYRSNGDTMDWERPV